MGSKPGWGMRVFGIVIGVGLLLGLPVAAAAEAVTLAWDPNPERDLAGYKVHMGTSPRAYKKAIDVGHATTYTISDLVPGETYFFAVTANDIFSNESNFSTEISTTIPLPIVPGPQDITTPTSEDQGTPAPTTTGDLWTWLRNLLFG